MVEFFFGFLLETLYSSQFCEFELNLDLIFCISSCIISFNMFMHHIVLLVLYFFWLTCSLPLVLFLLFFPFFCALVPYSSTMPRKTRANRVPSTLAVSLPRVQLLGISMRVRPMRNLIVNVRFGLSVLWFLMRSIHPLGLILSLEVGCHSYR